MTIEQQSQVDVSIFDLNGKLILTVWKTLVAGSHFLSLPFSGSGVFLYKVKTRNNEIVLKSNAIGGKLSGSSHITQSLSSKAFLKQTQSMTAMSDVIHITKDGLLDYRDSIKTSDTSGLSIKMIANAGNITDVDGNLYQIVQIGTQVWTVENWRCSKYNDGTIIPLDTSAATWAATTTPKYCFYNNSMDTSFQKKFGALYIWYVVADTNTHRLAPDGWHVPTDADWTTLEKYMILHGYNFDGTTDTTSWDRLARSLAAKTDWKTSTDTCGIGFCMTKNNSSGFSALPSGGRDSSGTFFFLNEAIAWWNPTLANVTDWGRALVYDDGGLSNLPRYQYNARYGFPVRLVKD